MAAAEAGRARDGAPAVPEGRDVVFYDGGCGFCQRSVLHLLDADPDGALFVYAPLEGETFPPAAQPVAAKALAIPTAAIRPIVLAIFRPSNRPGAHEPCGELLPAPRTGLLEAWQTRYHSPHDRRA